MVVDVHVHFLSPRAIEAARKSPERYGVRVLDDRARELVETATEHAARMSLAQSREASDAEFSACIQAGTDANRRIGALLRGGLLGNAGGTDGAPGG